MVRPSQLLHAQREPVAARTAATVLLLRDGPQGLQVLMTRRSPRASFAPGAYVFPGGVLDPADAGAHHRARTRPGQQGEALTEALAAIRECFEELGVLLAVDARGNWATHQQLARLDRRQSAQGLYDGCAAAGLMLAADTLFPLARWITDRDLPRRFDVPFFVAPMPPGQQPLADETEQFEPVWLRPADALARHTAGELLMIFPTVRTLQWLAQHGSSQSVLDACAGEAPLFTSCPRAGFLGGREARFMEHETAYGELELVSPDGQIVHTLDWRHDQPVRLLRNLQRLTCANPGAMTGPGTNSYLVGTPDSGHVVIDPGPDDPQHQERLWHAAGGDVRLIVCTHSHPDHSPGATRLADLCTARPAIAGLPSAPTARASSQFTPQRRLADGERLVLQGVAESHSLRVLHTPGHAANHLCLLLEEDGLLFTGDHVLNGSTTVIDPPDGDMSDYLDSLDRLAQVCRDEEVAFILPAHGHVLGGAAQAIARLKAHRLAREARVIAALRQMPQGSPRDWLRLAYDDVPERMWPVAERSLLAHVRRIEAVGLAGI